MRGALVAVVALVTAGGAASSGCRTAPVAPNQARGAAAGAAASDPGLTARPPMVTPGERMVYRLSMHQLEVGTFTIVVGDVQDLDGRAVVVVQSGVRSSKLVSMVREVADNFTSWIDAATSRPVLFRSSELASPKEGTIETADASPGAALDGRYEVRLQRGDAGEIVEHQRVSAPPLFDMNGFLVALRSWQAAPGSRVTADVIRSRFVWRTEITMAGVETIQTELGDLPAVRIDGQSRRLTREGEPDPKSDTRRYSVWISDDDERVPVQLVGRTDYGDLRFEIVEYQPGGGARLGG